MTEMNRWIAGGMIVLVMSLMATGYAKIEYQNEKINEIKMVQAERKVEFRHIMKELKEIKAELKDLKQK
ncbi:MAG: hypothetical protein ACTSQA_05265 [Candidatus Heimdallarchaeaceae archaeon]